MASENDTPQVAHFECTVCAQLIPFEEKSIQNIRCERCGQIHHMRPKSARLTLIYSLTALIFYFPANIFPFMTIELYGRQNSSTIWGGITSLADDGSWFLAIVVFLASLLIPLVKLVILFYLSLTNNSPKNQKRKTQLYHFIEAIGRWSMLDIFLLAILVAILKLGHFSNVKPEIGAALFALVVIFTLLASAKFDAKLIWKEENER